MEQAYMLVEAIGIRGHIKEKILANPIELAVVAYQHLMPLTISSSHPFNDDSTSFGLPRTGCRNLQSSLVDSVM